MALSICQRRRPGSEYLRELTASPRGRHDDRVDSTAQMLDWIKEAGAEPQGWMWQLYKERQRFQESRNPRPEPVIGDCQKVGSAPVIVTTAGAPAIFTKNRVERLQQHYPQQFLRRIRRPSQPR